MLAALLISLSVTRIDPRPPPYGEALFMKSIPAGTYLFETL